MIVFLPLDGGGEGGGDRKIINKFTKIAKVLRKRSTNEERFLWRHLKSKQLEGLKFRRQQPIGNFIVDFACFEKRIIIELDGGQHTNITEEKKDNFRDKWLKEQGFKVLRFWNNDVFKNINGILEVIIENCFKPPSPNPSHQGRGIN